VRARLEPDGVFGQWLQLYELSPQTLASLLASFLEVFPDGQAYTMWRSFDLLLVAAPPTRRLALERLHSREGRRMLRRANLSSAEALAGYYAGPLSSFGSVAAGAPLNRDDRPIVEYRAPRDLVIVGRVAQIGHPLESEMIPFVASIPEGPLFSAWSRESWYESRTRVLVEQGDLRHAEATAQAAREAGLTQLAGRLSGEVAASVRRKGAVEEAERARVSFAAGRESEGMQALLRAATLDPANGRIWLWIADRRRLAGDYAGAEADLTRGRAQGDPGIQAEAALISGMLEINRHRPLAAAARFREVQRWNPRWPDGYLYEARARAAGGDSAGARAAALRGLGVLPGEANLTELLASLDEER
jgi:hypothetical protein